MLPKVKVLIYEIFVKFLLFYIGILRYFGKSSLRSKVNPATTSTAPEKIALVSHILPPTTSGQSIMLERILRDLDPTQYLLIGTERTLVDAKDQIPTLKGKRVTIIDDIPAERFYFRGILYIFIAIYKSYKRGLLISKLVQEENCTVIISCSGDPYDLPAAYFASELTSTKLFPYYFDDYFYQWGDKQHTRLAGVFERLLLKNAEGFIVPNEFMQHALVSRKQVKTKIVRNPTDSKPADYKQAKKANARKDEYKILFAGSIYHINSQAFQLLLKALKLLKPYELNCTLHIYSNQSAETIASYGIEGENVVVHGHIPPSEIKTKMAEADILLIPYAFNSEVPEVVKTSAPGKLGDYLASGTPILAIAPTDSFIAWYLREKKCGEVVDSNVPVWIAKGIEKIINDQKAREQFIKNSLVEVKNEYSMKKAAQDFNDFIFNVESQTTNILYITACELTGQLFNGYLLGKHLDEQKFKSYMSVAFKRGDSANVFEYGDGEYYSNRSRLLRKYSDIRGRQSLLSNYKISSILPGNLLDDMDIIHLHIFHGAPFFNLEVLPELCRRFKVVLTVHDQWIMSGHCTYSLDCPGWLNGCGNCPDLDRGLAMKVDNTAEMYKIKKRIFDQCELQLVVASQWMGDRVKESPITNRFPVEYIPFGFDQSQFYPEAGRSIRKQFNIPSKHKVISFRSNNSIVYKGFPYLWEALHNVDYDDLTIISFDQTGCLEALRSRFNIIDLGWVDDVSTLRKVFSISDLFLSPSVAESFGVMPVEAMACGAVPVVFKDTVLAETIGWPETGVAVPYLDVYEYAAAITSLLRDDDRVKTLSKKGIKMVKSRYPLSKYVDEHEKLYRRLAAASGNE